jgi:SAM-dependent methyltransferase
VAGEVPRGRVLEIGCGDGALVERLLAGGHEEVVAVDLSEEELARVDGRAGRVRARAQALPFAEGCFDAVVSHLVWMLVPDAAVMVAEAARVLADGGRFVALVGGGPTVEDDGYARLVAHARPTPLGGDRRLRSTVGIAGLLDGFEEVTQRDHHVDLSGPPEALAMLDYGLEGVDVGAVCADLIEGGIVPCRAHVRLVTATRRSRDATPSGGRSPGR